MNAAPAPVTSPARRRFLVLVIAAATVLAIVGAYAGWRLAGDPNERTGFGAGRGSNTSSGTPDQGPACGFADEFTGGTVDAGWEQITQSGGFTLAGGSVEVAAPDGSDIYNTELRAPMLLRVPSGDFTIETDVSAGPSQFYQGAGLVLWNGSQSYVRLERGFGNVDAIVFEYKSGDQHIKVNPPFTGPNVIRTAAKRVVLQLSKRTSTVTARWREYGDTNWRDIGTIEIALPAGTKAGVAVLNRAQGGAKPQSFTARFEYVKVTCP